MLKHLSDPIVWLFLLPVVVFAVIALMVGVALVVRWIWPGALEPKPEAAKDRSIVKRPECEPTAGRYFYDDLDGGGS